MSWSRSLTLLCVALFMCVATTVAPAQVSQGFLVVTYSADDESTVFRLYTNRLTDGRITAQGEFINGGVQAISGVVEFASGTFGNARLSSLETTLASSLSSDFVSAYLAARQTFEPTGGVFVENFGSDLTPTPSSPPSFVGGGFEMRVYDRAGQFVPSDRLESSLASCPPDQKWEVSINVHIGITPSVDFQMKTTTTTKQLKESLVKAIVPLLNTLKNLGVFPETMKNLIDWMETLPSPTTSTPSKIPPRQPKPRQP